MIDGKFFFDQPVKMIKEHMITFEKLQLVKEMITNMITNQLFVYFKNYYKMIAIDLSKQEALDADPKATQQINFTANLDRVGNTTVFFIIEKAKEAILDFSPGNVRVL